MWYRVFCRSAEAPAPADLLSRLTAGGRSVTGSFDPPGRGWKSAEIGLGGGTPVYVERLQTEADDLRNDLNTWAAVLETMDYSPNHTRLMEDVIQTRQLFTVRKPLDQANEAAVDDVCRQLCVDLAGTADGVFQVEDDGWYAADGTLLLKEY